MRATPPSNRMFYGTIIDLSRRMGRRADWLFPDRCRIASFRRPAGRQFTHMAFIWTGAISLQFTDYSPIVIINDGGHAGLASR